MKAVLAFRILWQFLCSRAGLFFDDIDEVFWPKVICAWISHLALVGTPEPPNAHLEHAFLVSVITNLPEQTKNHVLLRSSFAGGVDLDWIARRAKSTVNSVVVEALLARMGDGADSVAHCRELSGKLVIGKDAFQKLERWLIRGMESSYVFLQSYESVLKKHDITVGNSALLAVDDGKPLREANLPPIGEVDHFGRFAREVTRVIAGLRGKVITRDEFDFRISKYVELALGELLGSLEVDSSTAGAHRSCEPPIVRKEMVELDCLDCGPIDVGSLISFVHGEVNAVRTASTWGERELRELLEVVEEEHGRRDVWCEFFEYNSGAVQVLRNKASERSAELKEGPKSVAPKRREVRKEVFISYAWGGESGLIVEYLRETLQNRQIDVRYDRSDLKYRDSIGEFMNRLGQGKCVVVVVGVAYLRSRNCMFELLSIMGHGEPRGRIFPIVLKEANVFNPLGVLEYVEYWESMKAELKGKLGAVGSENLQEIYSEVDLYGKIRASFSGIAGFLRDMNALSVEEHSASHFEDLIGQVEDRLSK